MTKLEDQISSNRTMQYMSTVMFILAEIVCLLSAYKLNLHPGLHFNILAFGLPLLAAVPYIISQQGHRFLRRLGDEEMSTTTKLTLSRQLSFGANAAYSLFIVTIAVADSTI